MIKQPYKSPLKNTAIKHDYKHSITRAKRASYRRLYSVLIALCAIAVLLQLLY